jgi:hypothetical protein
MLFVPDYVFLPLKCVFMQDKLHFPFQTRIITSHPPTTHNISIATMPSWGIPQSEKLTNLFKTGAIDPHNLTAAYLWAKTIQHFPNYKGKEGSTSTWNNAIAQL